METLGLAQSMRVESCSGQEMANTVWGFAKLGEVWGAAVGFEKSAHSWKTSGSPLGSPQ